MQKQNQREQRVFQVAARLLATKAKIAFCSSLTPMTSLASEEEQILQQENSAFSVITARADEFIASVDTTSTSTVTGYSQTSHFLQVHP